MLQYKTKFDIRLRQKIIQVGFLIEAISAGGYHTVGLKSDGTVVAAGLNDKGQCEVSGWSNIKLPVR